MVSQNQEKKREREDRKERKKERYSKVKELEKKEKGRGKERLKFQFTRQLARSNLLSVMKEQFFWVLVFTKLSLWHKATSMGHLVTI